MSHGPALKHREVGEGAMVKFLHGGTERKVDREKPWVSHGVMEYIRYKIGIYPIEITYPNHISIYDCDMGLGCDIIGIIWEI